MRESFEKDIQELNDMFHSMCKKAQQVITLSMESLKERNVDKAKRAIELDDEIDELEHEIERKCLLLIALQQPIAKDLRNLGTILKMITDMERVGDYGVNIARITIDDKDEKVLISLEDVSAMEEIIQTMLTNSIESFLKLDIQLAKEVAMMDDKVDNLFESMNNKIIIAINENPSSAREATHILLVARHLERIADHITNICERIIYMVTGELVEIN